MIRATFQLDLSGLEAIGKRGTERRKATRIALNKAAVGVKNAVITFAERIALRGFLARSERIKVKLYDSGKAVVVIGPGSKFSRVLRGKITKGPRKGQPRGRKVPAWYAHLVEKGTKRSRKRPHLEPALKARWKQFQRDVCDEMSQSIAAILAKHGKR